ncbi:MAG: alpha/beta hydrolase [Planctomycetaceae bacterium]|nr:alpha/beta hydrolase [Planctomycetaceae bacterium]
MKNVVFGFVLMLLICTFANAMQVQTDIEYGNAGGEKLLLDVYEPNGSGVFPAVIVVHGGAWIGGDKQGDEKIFAKPLTDADFVCVSINYRLAPKHKWPACYEDVQTAIKWVKANGSQYKINPNCIAVMGYSAGGQIAALAAMTSDNDKEVQAIVLVASPTDLVYDGMRRGDISIYLNTVLGFKKLDAQSLQLLWDISPINYVRPGLPPFLLMHGTADTTVPYQLSINFKTRLDVTNVPYDIISIEGGTHNIKGWGACDKEYVNKTVEWLKNNLKHNLNSK